MDNNQLSTVMIVDDQEQVLNLVSWMLKGANYTCLKADSAENAMLKLSQIQCDVVLSDLNMDEKDGFWLLNQVQEKYPDIAVLMMTAMKDVGSAISCLKNGAYDYLMKPFGKEDLHFSISRACERRNLILENRRYQHSLELQVEQRTSQLSAALQKLENSYELTVKSLMSALDAREKNTEHHSRRVYHNAIVLADTLGVDERTMESIRKGALLHDVGKIGVPDSILLKPGPLDAKEWAMMKMHPEIGARIIESIDFLKPAKDIVFSHHERYDGKGYPLRLSGNGIPLSARVFSVIDSLDAMINDRPYRSSMSIDRATEELLRCSGSQFDPVVLSAFQKVDSNLWSRSSQKEDLELSAFAFLEE